VLPWWGDHKLVGARLRYAVHIVIEATQSVDAELTGDGLVARVWAAFMPSYPELCGDHIVEKVAWVNCDFASELRGPGEGEDAFVATAIIDPGVELADGVGRAHRWGTHWVF